MGAAAIAATVMSVLVTSLPLDADAQAFPNKAFRLEVGAPAGGGTDIVARMLGEKLGASMGQSFVVENRPGASNTIAADFTAKAAPDGYTLLVATNTGQAIAPHLMKLNFDVIKDLAPVALVMVVPNVLIVGPNVTAKDVKELVAQMKAKPDTFNFASSGSGSTQHLAGEAFKKLAGVQMQHVPYKGSSQAHADMLGGQAQPGVFDTTSSAIGQIKGGKLRALAVTSSKRSAELPDVPTLAEAGFPGLDMTTWYGVFAPAATPKEVVNKLHDEIAAALKTPEVQKRIAGLAGEPGNLTVGEFAEMNRADYERYGKLIRETGIKLE